MEIHQLTYFVAVAQTGSFSRAAEQCLVTQPSLSQQIIKLEQELGEQLFDRLHRRVVLTEAGRILLPRANLILSEVNDIKLRLTDDIKEGRGLLSVGFIPTIAPFVLPRTIKRFAESFPHARLMVQEDLTENLVRELVDGKIDVAITSLPIHNDQIQTIELRTEPLLVASAVENLMNRQASILVKELEEYPFIALNEMHCLGAQVQDFCYKANLDIKIVCNTTQLSTVQRCVALGLGVSLVPQAQAALDTTGRISYRALTDANPERKIAAAIHKDRRQSYLAQQFIEIVRDEYGNA
ncbi:MAG: LysR family transcriptional regulator [Bellilinea sp.]